MEQSRIPSLTLTACLVAASFVACTDGGGDGRAKSGDGDTGVVLDDTGIMFDELEVEDLSGPECGSLEKRTEFVIRSNADVERMSNCEVVHGYVEITGDVTSLEGLSMREISSGLRVEGTYLLESLKGLEQLTTVSDGISIFDNYALIDLDGLRNLEEMHGLDVQGNENLQYLSSFSTLRRGQLYVEDNPSLLAIEGFESMSEEDSYITIISNQSLEVISGFGSLLNAQVWIYENPSLVSVSGFMDLEKSFSQLSITENDRLERIEGFDSLRETDYLLITDNPSLQIIDGFGSLLWVRGDLVIGDNASLNQLHAFESVKRVRQYLMVYYNDLCGADIPTSLFWAYAEERVIRVDC